MVRYHERFVTFLALAAAGLLPIWLLCDAAWFLIGEGLLPKAIKVGHIVGPAWVVSGLYLAGLAIWAARLRYSLRTLMLMILLLTSLGGLWYNWKPYYCVSAQDRFNVQMEAHRPWWSPPGSYYNPWRFIYQEEPRNPKWLSRRPEEWWGVAWLPEFWLMVACGTSFVWSVVADRRYFRALDARLAAEAATKGQQT